MADLLKMPMPSSSSPDRLHRRCPRLGHWVAFEYCRIGPDGEPCFKVLDCWWEQFDVVTYFKACLSEEAFSKLQTAKAPNKVASLVDLIQQARERMKD